MKLFYHAEDGRMGDIIPFYEDGVFKLFYLGYGWSNVSTQDQLHFYDQYRTEIHGGTGSVLKVDGVYHMFYCKFTFTPYMRQYVCHAVSEDLKEWRELPEIPGGYYVSRNLDNAFRAVVLSGNDARESLFYWTSSTNEEIARKRHEMGLND